VEGKLVTISDEDRKNFISEIHYYIMTVVIPLNLIFMVFLLLPDNAKYLSAVALLLDALIYLTKIKPAYDDMSGNKFYCKQGVLRAVKFRLSFEKFEYRLDGDPEVFSSVTSRYTSSLEHAVEVVYAEKSHRIIKLKHT
jgi:hypothetical protein